MGYLFDERKFIKSNAEWIDSHLNSQYSRFLDSAPTYVTYYNVNNIETTVDLGFRNVEKILGKNSPVRFNKVDGLPLYGMEQIVPSLEEGEEGPSYSYDGSAIILPSTVKPLPNDFFIIDYLDSSFVFMVTNLAVDGIREEGYYEIDFTLKHINEGKLEDLERQTVEEFQCYVDRIGTEEKVLMRSADVEILSKLNEITSEISNYYLLLFYDRKYNSFLFNRPNRTRLYDRLLTHFINKNKVFHQRSEYDTIMLTSEDPNKMLLMEYHHSIYRAIEEQKPELVKQMFYGEGFANDFGSIFYHWGDNSIRTTYFNVGNEPYLNAETIEVFHDAESFYTKDENEVLPVEPILNISIPVNGGEVFTQDAGYKHASTKGDSSLSDSEASSKPVEKNEPPSKIRLNDIEALLDTPAVDMDLSVRVQEPHPTINVITNEPETPFEGEVRVTNLVDKVIEHVVKQPEGMDVVGRTITMYLSKNVTKLSDLEIDELLNYADYMLPNRETFILIPILLFVLESYYKTSISNN